MKVEYSYINYAIVSNRDNTNFYEYNNSLIETSVALHCLYKELIVVCLMDLCNWTAVVLRLSFYATLIV